MLLARLRKNAIGEHFPKQARTPSKLVMCWPIFNTASKYAYIINRLQRALLANGRFRSKRPNDSACGVSFPAYLPLGDEAVGSPCLMMFMAMATMEPTSLTAAGMIRLLPSLASLPNSAMYCSATRSWRA